MPQPCWSQKFDQPIAAAVDQYWRDFPRAQWLKAQYCQESHLDPNAVSPVGAEGLAQIMPATYQEIVRTLKWDAAVSAFDPDRAIAAGAFYQGRMRRVWSAEGRTGEGRNKLGNAAYNAGAGSILKAQTTCNGARLWEDIAPCLASITGPAHADETLTYVKHIAEFALEIGYLPP